MTDTAAAKRVVIAADPDALAASVASRFVRIVQRQVDAGEQVHICLTGGSMAGRVLGAAAADPRARTIDWSHVHFWWGDERFVPAGSAERNDTIAHDVFLDVLDIRPENVHAVAAGGGTLDLDAAAIAYADELAQYAPPGAAGPWPAFDICFLGVGPDAHIASLFPDRPEILVTDRATVAVRDSPKPPPERVSLTRPVINASTRVWLVLAGQDKASALGLALAGASYTSVPAAGAKGRSRTVFFVDEAAAADVPPQLIDQDY